MNDLKRAMDCAHRAHGYATSGDYRTAIQELTLAIGLLAEVVAATDEAKRVKPRKDGYVCTIAKYFSS